MKVVMRYQTKDRAMAAARRLVAAHGALFVLTEDRSPSGGGDFAPYVVMGLLGWYDRKAA